MPRTTRPGERLHTGRIVPVYETHRQRHDQHAAPVRVAGARAAAGRGSSIRCPADILARERWPVAHARACGRRIFPPADTHVDALNAFETPAQRRLIFEDFFVFQIGLALRRHENAQVRKGRVPMVDDRIRAVARARCCRSS